MATITKKKPAAKKTAVKRKTTKKAAKPAAKKKTTAKKKIAPKKKTSKNTLNIAKSIAQSSLAEMRDKKPLEVIAELAPIEPQTEYATEENPVSESALNDNGQEFIREEVMPSPEAEPDISADEEMADTQEEIEATDSDEAQQIIENIEIPVESPDEDIKLNEKVKSVDSGAETTELQLVCFSLEKEEFGVDIHRVQEIIRPVLVTAMPEAPVFVNGVINLRGKVIPIIDLRNRVGLVSREDDKNTRIVVFDHNNKLIGMVVDAVTEVLRVSSAKLEPIPPQASTVGAEFVKGIIRMDSKLILVIDCEKILQM